METDRRANSGNRESLGISCFQGFLSIYRYKEKVVRVDDFY